MWPGRTGGEGEAVLRGDTWGLAYFSQVGLFVDFFARLFTQLKFGVVQACILFTVLGVPGCQHLQSAFLCRNELTSKYDLRRAIYSPFGFQVFHYRQRTQGKDFL